LINNGRNGPGKRSNLFESHWSNQWLTFVIVMDQMMRNYIVRNRPRPLLPQPPWMKGVIPFGAYDVRFQLEPPDIFTFYPSFSLVNASI
jgi:hypothetical protein